MEKNDCILIVDDEPDIRRLLVDYLTRNALRPLPPTTGARCGTCWSATRWICWYWT